jgi:rhodanese-related sulfurtransferase
MSSVPFHEINVTELAAKLADPDRCCQLIDVREPQELAIVSLPNFMSFPLSEHSQWSETIQTELQPTIETIVLCHHGMRSAQMCGWLASQGFTDLYNVMGGIDAYARAIDASLPKY